MLCAAYNLSAIVSSPTTSGLPLYRHHYPTVTYSRRASGTSRDVLPRSALVIERVHR